MRLRRKLKFTKDHRRRNMILYSFFFLFLFIGIGYATLSTKLDVQGSLEVKKHLAPTFPNLLKEEADIGTFARKSTTLIDDAYNSSLNTEPLYHWYSSTQMIDKVNVIFANHCWQMIRTTSSGGIKLLYNGEVVNGKCLSDRPNHLGYKVGTAYLSSPIYFASDYEYDSTTSQFRLKGEPFLDNWNASNAPNLVGKYTCNSTSADATCSTLYIIRSYNSALYSSYNALVYTITSNNNYAGIGTFPLNSIFSPLAGFSYMYNEDYPYSSYFLLKTNNDLDSQISTRNFYSVNYTSISDYTSLWYADSISYNNGYYELNNPYQVTSAVDFSSLYGKFYVSPVNGSYPSNITKVNYILSSNYVLVLSGGKLLSDYEPIVLGDSYVDNGNGTYTLQNTISVSVLEFYQNTYTNKYFCVNHLENPCTEIRFFRSSGTSSYKSFYAVDPTQYYYYGTGHNGLALIDPVKIYHDDLWLNYSNYTSRKFFCLSHNSTCDDNDDLAFVDFSVSGTFVNHSFKYAPNYSFGASVTWDGEKYHLNNTIGVENYTNTSLTSTHHYICEDLSTTCESVIYLFYQYGGQDTSVGDDHFWGITLQNGISSPADIINEMLKHNVKDSTSKYLIELWYERNLMDYTSYLENVIFYNDKSLNIYGGFDNRYSSHDGIRFYPRFVYDGYNINSVSISQSMAKEYSYSVDNPYAPLKYSIGLPTKADISFMPTSIVSPQYMLTADPWDRNGDSSRIVVGKRNGDFSLNTNYSNSFIVRPVISLKGSVQYSSGDGSRETPYIAVTQ